MMFETLKQHWPEYLMEGAELGLFMISACVFGTLLEHPSSPLHQAIPDAFLRRILMGMIMGLTAISIIYSPWGKQSGAHFNPAVTLTFFRLRKVQAWDAFFYVGAQFFGGIAGVLLASFAIGQFLAHPSVNFVVTAPGPRGVAFAFLGELVISFVLMSVILRAMNHHRLMRFTGWFAGTLVALYIILEAPISGMSMNPARTLGSALPAHFWTALWLYFVAPPLGMLLASELFLRQNQMRTSMCAKLNHQNNKRCIFRCNYRTTASSLP